MNKQEKDSVCVEPSSYERLFALPCVTCVCREGGTIKVLLNQTHTWGSTCRASTGDWLVEMVPGKWRRFSHKEYARLVSSRRRAKAEPNTTNP